MFRELGHGTYLFWILLQLAFTWGVGVSRFNDNKHHPSDVSLGASAFWRPDPACSMPAWLFLLQPHPEHARSVPVNSGFTLWSAIGGQVTGSMRIPSDQEYLAGRA